MVSYFHEKRFPRTCRDVITIDPIRNCGFVLFINCLFQALRGFSFRTCMVKCVPFLDVASRIDHDIFCMFCSSRWFPFPLILSCWCPMHRVRTLFFHSPIYFPLHKQSSWYAPGWLFGGSSLGLFFWQKI